MKGRTSDQAVADPGHSGKETEVDTHPPASPSSSSSSSSSTTTTGSTTSRCPKDKFLYIGNTFGRHNNQLMSVMTGMVVARKLNRTLVIPPFSDGSASANKKGTAPKFDMDTFYVMDQLMAHECVTFERDWMKTMRMKKDEGGGGDDAVKSSPLRVKAACITMRGIQVHPQQPVGGKFACVSEHFVKYKKRAPLFYEVATSPDASAATILTVPLVLYLSEALSLEEAAGPWKYLKPLPAVTTLARNIADRLRKPDADSDTSAKSKAMLVATGVHYRSLEGSCAKRVGEFINRKEHPKKFEAVTQQCEMTPAYIEGFALAEKERFAGGERKGWSLLIADDGQRPDTVKRMTDRVPRRDGALAVRMATMADPGSQQGPGKQEGHPSLRSVRATLQIVEKVLAGPSPAGEEGRDGADTSLLLSAKAMGQLPKNIPMFRLLVDFWTLVEADVFIGNQLSTLSLNVCKARLARGKRCDNFVL